MLNAIRNLIEGHIGLKGKLNSDSVYVLLSDGSNNALIVSGTSVPSATTGYAIGCFYIKTDNGAQYRNTGSATSCTFTLIGTVGAGSVSATELASNAVTTAKILNANVTLAKLASGITPSHIVVYAGKVTWSGSGASKVATVTGVASTDVVVASIQTAPTEAAYLKSAAPTTDTVTFVLSAANTSNDAVISYSVLRAAA